MKTPGSRIFSLVIFLSLAVLSGVLGLSAGRAGTAPEVLVVGSGQVVFDWNRQACSEVEQPDLPVRAFRAASGQVQLLLSNYVSYRMTGPNMNRLRPICRPVLFSQGDSDPSRYQDRRWIASPFTLDGRHVWALVHEEYQGNRHRGRCPEHAYYPCWYNAITLARSSDGGRSYHQARPPRQFVAGALRRYRHGVGPIGVFAPSNLVKRGRYLYALVRVREPGRRPGNCLIRSGNIASAGSWRAWNGSGFTISFPDPYRSHHARRIECRQIAPDEIAEMTESLTFNTVLDRYLLVGMAGPPTKTSHGERGVYYSVSEDLVHWSPRRLVLQYSTLHSYRCGDPGPIAYPSVIDPSSRSRNFETTGARPFLYFTKFRYRACRKTANRDLMRIRLSIAEGG